AHAGRRLHDARCRHCPAALAPRSLRRQARQAGRAAHEVCRAHFLAPGLHRGAHALRKGNAQVIAMSTAEIPTKPYLLRALYEWCVDNGYTPHLAVKVDSRSQVPSEYVRNGEITLNISPSAVHKLQMGNELVEFSARFAGVARQISVPV